MIRQLIGPTCARYIIWSARSFSTTPCLAFLAFAPHARESTELSSTPAGTRLRGCNILKNGQDPEALPDNEYPDWLWELLDDDAQRKKLEADPEKKARKEWRKKNRDRIKQANFLKSMR
ncbi:mitochondrial ribosomal protein L37-domain-containing protein [Lipomyces orientalis]|uniref:Mitochondrial ribosomal protein L37-domain-containing protein n=1 Tax=Lipomyces orientalis TaxID=1233043 RepID=A0ACC3TN84_9ASCO